MTNLLLAVYVRHTQNKDEICFLVVAENEDRMGWPLMATFGKILWENYEPLRIADLGPAPDRDVGVIDMFGDPRSLPPRFSYPVPAYPQGQDLPPGLN